MKVVLAFSMLFLSFVVSGNVFAGEVKGGYISHVATVSGAILFGVNGGEGIGRPLCATTGRFAAKKDSEHYHAVLTAFQMGRQVNLGSVMGLGTCKLINNSEDLRWIEINNE